MWRLPDAVSHQMSVKCRRIWQPRLRDALHAEIQVYFPLWHGMTGEVRRGPALGTLPILHVIISRRAAKKAGWMLCAGRRRGAGEVRRGGKPSLFSRLFWRSFCGSHAYQRSSRAGRDEVPRDAARVWSGQAWSPRCKVTHPKHTPIFPWAPYLFFLNWFVWMFLDFLSHLDLGSCSQPKFLRVPPNETIPCHTHKPGDVRSITQINNTSTTLFLFINTHGLFLVHRR